MTAYIAGNSHVICLAEAARRSVAGGARHLSAKGISPRHFTVGDAGIFFTGITKDTLTPNMFGAVDRGSLKFTDQRFQQDLAGWTGETTVPATSPWGICNVANTSRRLYRDATWLTFAPTHLARAGLTPVTDDAIRAMLERDHRGARKLYERLAFLGVPTFAISGPPLRRDHPAIAEDGYRAELLQHLDSLAREVWRDWLVNRGLALIEPPIGTADADGFLRPEFENVREAGAADRIHANELYGDLMVARIAEHVARIGA
ncbi:hypothetical protein APR04_002051 [Promicromonospora umidemergens]|uniref:GDSL-like lipase/acylhydrolase family protein n=1 Tax=Promicromonospora umidemergens TaxID=629679 RepID=A0ABP8WP24_9MICO|nr:hypothetical protein [Promicromonospora umidemergens]MCP2283148.1 hypothetical protein [Promicromonospora umidemergens]